MFTYYVTCNNILFTLSDIKRDAMPLSEIEQEVLKALLGKEKLTIRELITAVSRSPNAIIAAVNKLIQLKLIEETREHEFPKRRYVKLTVKGVRAANLVNQLDELLRED